MRSSGRWRSTGFTWRRNITNATARISHRSIWPGEIFSGLNLRGIKMDRALLSGADFTGAHLQAANLAGAIAEQVCFDRADLSRARLSGANLVSASFRKRLPRQGRDGVRIDGQRSVARRLPASGFLVACSARYCCPPAASSACRIISFSARVILFVEPLGRPFPAPGGRVPFGAAISKPSLV